MVAVAEEAETLVVASVREAGGLMMTEMVAGESLEAEVVLAFLGRVGKVVEKVLEKVVEKAVERAIEDKDKIAVVETSQSSGNPHQVRNLPFKIATTHCNKPTCKF